MPSYKFQNQNIMPREIDENEERIEVSQEALSIFRHETIVGIMVAYHAYLSSRDDFSKHHAREKCLDIMSAMVEDGRCSAPDIQEFIDAVENSRPPFTVLGANTQGKNDATAVWLGAIINFTQSDRIGDLSESERTAVETFQTMGEEFRKKAGELYAMFRPHFQDIVSPILKSYHGFDSEFVQAFEK